MSAGAWHYLDNVLDIFGAGHAKAGAIRAFHYDSQSPRSWKNTAKIEHQASGKKTSKT